MATYFARLFGTRQWRSAAGLAIALLLLLATTAAGHHAEATGLRVSSQGDCLRLRGGPGLAGEVIGCIPDGATLVNAGQHASADGVDWTLVRWGEVVGWTAAQYLTEEGTALTSAPAAASSAPPVPAVTASRTGVAAPLREPPPGGLAVGVVSLVSPRAVVAAQPFEVTSLAVYDPATRAFLTYIPGSPVNVIGDDPLAAGTAVFVRRRGELPPTLPGPVPGPATTGTPAILVTPAPGGTVAGVAGTSDVAAFVAAQPFTVESVSTWDTTSQRWLIHIVGAPDFVSTLTPGLLSVDSVVFVKRGAVAPVALVTAPAPVPAAALAPTSTTPATTTAPGGYTTTSYGPASITFYYCAPGARNGAIGDGGGFCGHMANGERVHAGAASCAAAYMGQRFLIAGDPLNRVYTCKDTGGAVTARHRDIWFADSDEGGNWWRAVGLTAEIFAIVP